MRSKSIGLANSFIPPIYQRWIQPSQAKSGVTVVELLVVVGLMSLLFAILLPAVQSVREASRRSECTNRVRQLSLAMLNFEAGKQELPSGLTSKFPNPWMTWMAQILPFLDHQNEFNRSASDYKLFPDPFVGHLMFQTPLRIFACPSDPNSGLVHETHFNRLVACTNYLGVTGINYEIKGGVLFLDSRIRLAEVRDGLSNTLLIGERPPSSDYWYGWWYSGLGQGGTGSADSHLGVRELNLLPGKEETLTYLEDCPAGPYQFQVGRGEQRDTLHFWSHHPNGATFSRCDGSVHFMAYGMNDAMAALATRADSE